MDIRFFEKLWLSASETSIFLALYQLGTQPASVVARHVGMERTKTYRHLIRLSQLSIVRKTNKNGVQVFFVRDLSDLENLINKKTDDLAYIRDSQTEVLQEIQQMKSHSSNIPKITVYDGSFGVGNIFDDIFETVKTRGYRMIRMFATNTHMERNEDETAGKYASAFFEKLQAHQVTIDTYLWSGNFLMERVQHIVDTMNIQDIPATQSSINVILVGKAVYVVMYDKSPMGVKIENDTLGDIFHLLLDVAGK